MSLWSPLSARCPLMLLWQRWPQRRVEPGPAGCETILGRKRRESRSCVCRSPVSRVSLRALPCDFSPLLPPRIDSVILSPLYGKGMRMKIAFSLASSQVFFTLRLRDDIFIWLASVEFTIALYFCLLFSVYKLYKNP